VEDPLNRGRAFCTYFFKFVDMGEMCDAQLVLTAGGEAEPHDPDFVERYM
jgi:hypothetical protein